MKKRTFKKMCEKNKIRWKHRKKIRSKVFGTAKKPRCAVFKSNRYFYAQVIDDQKGYTLVSASTLEKGFPLKERSNREAAKALGELLSKRILAKSIQKIVFDRGGYPYHGRLKVFAESMREAGLQF